VEELIFGTVRITTTIIAPSFLTAALFKIVGDIIILLGPKYSRLKPVTCKQFFPASCLCRVDVSAYTHYLDLVVFITLDVAALVVQAVGGAKASIAAQTNNDPQPGGDIMLYGIVVQLIGVTLVCLFGIVNLGQTTNPVATLVRRLYNRIACPLHPRQAHPTSMVLRKVHRHHYQGGTQDD